MWVGWWLLQPGANTIPYNFQDCVIKDCAAYALFAGILNVHVRSLQPWSLLKKPCVDTLAYSPLLPWGARHKSEAAISKVGPPASAGPAFPAEVPNIKELRDKMSWLGPVWILDPRSYGHKKIVVFCHLIWGGLLCSKSTYSQFWSGRMCPGDLWFSLSPVNLRLNPSNVTYDISPNTPAWPCRLQLLPHLGSSAVPVASGA